MRKITMVLALMSATAASPAFAAYVVTAYTGTVGAPFNATLSAQSLFNNGTNNASKATFTYNGTLNFNSPGPQNTTNAGDLNGSFFTTPANILGYAYQYGPANSAYGPGFSTQADFLNTSGSVSNYRWGSLYIFESEAGDFGGQTLQIRHDDGVSVYLNGSNTAIAGFTAGPTSAITESVVLAAGTTSYVIAYGRQNGAPSVLQVQLNGAVPEPATWAMMIGGFGMIGYGMRRRNALRVTYAA